MHPKLKSSRLKHIEDSIEFKKGLAYMDTLMVKEGKPVPADEDGKGAVARIKPKSDIRLQPNCVQLSCRFLLCFPKT